jgi:hypothetical protein
MFKRAHAIGSKFASERGQEVSIREIVNEVLDEYLATLRHRYFDGRIIPIPPSNPQPVFSPAFGPGTPRLIWTPP